mgnify:CR=1 FL=1
MLWNVMVGAEHGLAARERAAFGALQKCVLEGVCSLANAAPVAGKEHVSVGCCLAPLTPFAAVSSGKSPRNADRKCHAWKGFCTNPSCRALLPALGKAKTGSALRPLAHRGEGVRQGGCSEQKFWLVAVCSDPSYEIVMPLPGVPRDVR